MALEELFDAGTLPELRRAVVEEAVAAGLAGERASDVALALHELAANAVRHGGGAGRLQMTVIGGALQCQVSDDGPGARGQASAPGLGTAGPWPLRPGHGLWLVTGLADQVDFAPGQGGSEVTVTFTLQPGTGSERAGCLPAGSDWTGAGGDGW
jgi:anti-sigma regulatory factor (Ser/Thr protein kinase)